jgi:hypothetical protein
MANWMNAVPGQTLERLAGWALVVAMGLLLPGASWAVADDVETRDFTISVDGKAAGKYHTTIRRKDDGTVTFAAESEVKVSVLAITMYSYTYRGLEQWNHGRLQHFESSGKENGKPFTVTADSDAAGLHVKANGQEHVVSGDVWTTSFWQLPPAKYRNQALTLLGCDNGQERGSQLQWAGTAKLKVGEQEQTLSHYRVMRDVSYDLWYDAQDRLVRQEWVSNGHRTIMELVRP